MIPYNGINYKKKRNLHPLKESYNRWQILLLENSLLRKGVEPYFFSIVLNRYKCYLLAGVNRYFGLKIIKRKICV